MERIASNSQFPIPNSQLKNILSNEQWLITEKEYIPEKLRIYETLFTLANGYIGVRGNVPWESRYGWPCTFFAGVYDRALEVKSELANAPDWTGLKLTVGDEIVNFEKGKLLNYERKLDMYKGILYEEFKWQSPKDKIIVVETIRLVHLKEKHKGLIYGRLVAENYSGQVVLEGGINGLVFNTGYAEQLKNKHFELIQQKDMADAVYLEMKTYGTKITVGEATQLVVNTDFARDVKYEKDYIANVLLFNVEKGKQYEFCKYVSFYTSRDVKAIEVATLSELKEGVNRGYQGVINTHALAWQKKWEIADIKIEHDEIAQKSLRFNIFHLIQCANPEDERISIPAKGLHGEGYKGHIFWDTEIYMLPFFIYTDHKAARALLMYRYNMLDGARKNAKLNGYRGAQFPWESTDDGTETIPKEVGNPFDKTFRVYEGEEEHHVIADIAYAVDHYYQATQDKEFMLNYGLEILFETARFWASRVEFDKVRKKYVIKRVIGPDEIHYHCDNSAFTNFMAKWNLERAATYAEEFKSCDAVKKLGVTTDEITSWYEIADKILIPYDEQSGIYEQFDGYFDLEEVKLEWPATDSYRVRTNIPIIPDKWRDWQKLMKTKLIKQPDVVLLLYLFREQFSTDEKKVNFDFYNPYTTYRSSLSASISSIIANETGYQDLAYRYFLMSARVGLDDIYKNTEHGFHAAAAGGTWQAVVNGFAGMRIHNDRLDFDPRLPREWYRLSFTIIWRGKPISIEITPTTFTVWSKSEKLDAEVEISVRNTLVKVKREKQTLRLNS